MSISPTNLNFKNPKVMNNVNNPPLKTVILPSLVLAKLAYSLGSEKPENRNNVIKQTLISWLFGLSLASKAVPYYTLPITAISLAIYKMAQKNNSQDMMDVGINHASWWLCGVGMKNLTKSLENNSGVSKFFGFAVGASVVGPVVANFIKSKVLPLINQNNLLKNTKIENIMLDSPDSTRKVALINPLFTDTKKILASPPPPAAPIAANTNNTVSNPTPKHDPSDPYCVKGLFPERLNKI